MLPHFFFSFSLSMLICIRGIHRFYWKGISRCSIPHISSKGAVSDNHSPYVMATRKRSLILMILLYSSLSAVSIFLFVVVEHHKACFPHFLLVSLFLCFYYIKAIVKLITYDQHGYESLVACRGHRSVLLLVLIRAALPLTCSG